MEKYRIRYHIIYHGEHIGHTGYSTVMAEDRTQAVILFRKFLKKRWEKTRCTIYREHPGTDDRCAVDLTDTDVIVKSHGEMWFKFYDIKAWPCVKCTEPVLYWERENETVDYESMDLKRYCVAVYRYSLAGLEDYERYKQDPDHYGLVKRYNPRLACRKLYGIAWADSAKTITALTDGNHAESGSDRVRYVTRYEDADEKFRTLCREGSYSEAERSHA